MDQIVEVGEILQKSCGKIVAGKFALFLAPANFRNNFAHGLTLTYI